MTSRKPESKFSPLFGAVLITLIFGFIQLPFSQFMADDFMQLTMLEGVSPHTWTGPADLYTLADGNPGHMKISKDEGAWQWFQDPQLKVKFFRPLTSLLLALDHAVFGINPIGYGIHNILWFLSLVIAVGIIIKRLSRTPGRGGDSFFALPDPVCTWAIYIFALSGIHWYVVYWAACRHIIIAGSIAAWSLSAYIKWREEGWKKGRIISVFGFITALFAGETALAVLAYLLAYEIILPSRDLKAKLKNLSPFLVLVAVYLIFHKFAGYGAAAGAGYIDPLKETLRFISTAPGHLIALAGSMFLGGHAELWLIPAVRPFVIIAGSLLVVAVGFTIKKLVPYGDAKEIKTLLWFLTGSLLSLIPFSAVTPGARLLVVPFVGCSVIIAFMFFHRPEIAREQKGFGVKSITLFCWFLMAVHLFIAPIQRLAGPAFAEKVFVQRLEKVLGEAEYNHEQPPQKLVFLVVPDFSIGLHSYYYLKLKRRPMPQSWWVLSWEKCDHRVVRSAENELELQLVGGSIKNSFLKEGTVVELSGMKATVLQVGEGGAKRIVFRFDRSLDDASIRFLAWQEGRLKHVQPPPVGESLLVRK